jgi:hypothetical protein
MAFGIIQGIRDEEPRLYNFFKHMFKNMFDNASKGGKNTRGGAGRALMANAGGGRMNNRNIERRSRGPVVMNVHAHHSESLMTVMVRARFRMKNTLR